MVGGIWQLCVGSCTEESRNIDLAGGSQDEIGDGCSQLVDQDQEGQVHVFRDPGGVSSVPHESSRFERELKTEDAVNAGRRTQDGETEGEGVQGRRTQTESASGGGTAQERSVRI